MNNYKVLQRTIASAISFSGVGLHSGELCNVTLNLVKQIQELFL